MQDVALKRNPANGKFVFDRDPVTGDVKRSPWQEYAVLVTLASRKGEYFWDSTGEQGTLLYSVVKDGFATGSQLAAYAQDGIDQCKAAEVITGGSATAERLGTGRWAVRVKWTVAGGRQAPPQSLRF